MSRILDIALKDLIQLMRDFRTFMFMVLMPILFTFLFGYAFGGFGGEGSDSRLPVGLLSHDDRWISASLQDLMADSELIRIETDGSWTETDLDRMVAEGDLAAAVIVPRGYSKAVLADKTARLIVIAEPGTAAWITVEAELLKLVSRLDGAVRSATIMEALDGKHIPFEYGFEQTLTSWEDPPIAVVETTSSALAESDEAIATVAHVSPGMMLQFAIAGLMTAAQIIVTERRSRTLKRLLTTSVRRVHILLGHYLAIFVPIMLQFTLLIIFGQFVLRVEYLRVPEAIFLMATCAALCIAALGLLIGVVARSEEQAISFSLIPMFVLSGLGGAWMPLEFTGETFQTVGHLSPVAWAMDGFKNITIRGLGLDSVLVPCAVLAGYAVVFFALAAWRLSVAEETG
jgi:ABC-2 type transport system permease protein